jgi:WD40 repeat protein
VKDAEHRTWEVVKRAFDERPPSRRSRAGNTVLLAAVLAGLVTATVGAAASSPGQAVIDHVRQVVGISHADEALFSLPAPGRLLVVSSDGGGVWLAHDNGYKRKLGAYKDAEWSPHGLYVVATTNTHLIALDLEHGVRWMLARDNPVWPRWEGTRTDTRIAYMTASGLRVVAGDGTGDKLLDRYAGDVPPAWDPGSSHSIAYYSGESIVLRHADSADVVWRAPIDVIPSALQWSDDGRFLVVTASPKTVVLDARGHVHRTISMLGSQLLETAFRPHTHQLAVSLRFPQRSQIRIVDVDRPGRASLLFAGPGSFGDIAWSPNGRWLLLNWPSADQWLFVSGSQVHAVGNIAQEFPRHDKLGPMLQIAQRWCC